MIIDFSQNFNIESLTPQTEFEEKVVAFVAEWMSDSETVSVQTSGSTGKPKIIQIEKRRMISSAKMTCDFLRLKTGDSALLCLPVEYISGKMMIVRAFERGLKLHIATPSSQPLIVLDKDVNFCAMSPLQVENSIDKIKHIKKLIIGGAQVSENLKKKIHSQLAGNARTQSSFIYESYGMSETLSHIALKEIYPSSEEYFTAFENVEITLDSRKCLQISAPHLHPTILQTNDIVEFKNEKEFKFLGRIDNVINSGGLKIHPEELESIVKQHISNEAVFIGINDDKLGQKLLVIIEGEDFEGLQRNIEIALEEIEITFTKNHKPKEIRFLKSFPRTPNGKIDRPELINLIEKAYF